MNKREFLHAGAGLALASVASSSSAASSSVALTREEYQTYVDLFNANDPRFIEYYHPDVVLELPSSEIRGDTGIRDFYANVKKYIREQVDVTVFVADENTVAVEIPTRFECIADWEDSFWGVPLKKGQVMRIISFGFYQVEERKFKHIKSARYKMIHDWQFEQA
ncbi:MAG TPA: nuclear transport factor 2 family protein [Pseudomonadales bacterium]